MCNQYRAARLASIVVGYSLVACAPPLSTSRLAAPDAATSPTASEPEAASSQADAQRAGPDAHEAIAETLAEIEGTGLATSEAYLVAAPIVEKSDGGLKMRTESRQTPLFLLADLFGDSKVCSLPAKLRKKLKKNKDEQPADTLPSDVLEGIKDLKDVDAPYFTAVNFPYIIHILQFSATKPADSFVFDPNTSPKIDGAPTIRNLDLRRIQAAGTTNLFYELDCSGYLTAAMNVKAGAGVAKVETEAAAKMSASASMAALRVIVASPVGLALREGAYQSDNRLPPLTRFGVLFSLADKARDQDANAYIVAPKYVQIVATSTQKGRKLQGSMDLSASGGGGAGIVSGQGSIESGFSISNGLSYEKFSVLYLDPPEPLRGVVAQQVKTVRETVQRMVSEASLGLQFDTVAGARVFHPVLPSAVCLLDWELGGAEATGQGLGKVESTMTDGDNDGVPTCTFSLSLSATGVAEAKAGTLYAHYADLTLKMRVPTLPAS